MDRFRYQATKASQVQSRVKMLEKMTPIEVPPERKRVHFSLPACPKSGRLVLDLHQVRKAYGDTLVFRHAHVHIGARRPNRLDRSQRRGEVDR